MRIFSTFLTLVALTATGCSSTGETDDMNGAADSLHDGDRVGFGPVGTYATCSLLGANQDAGIECSVQPGLPFNFVELHPEGEDAQLLRPNPSEPRQIARWFGASAGTRVTARLSLPGNVEIVQSAQISAGAPIQFGVREETLVVNIHNASPATIIVSSESWSASTEPLSAAVRVEAPAQTNANVRATLAIPQFALAAGATETLTVALPRRVPSSPNAPLPNVRIRYRGTTLLTPMAASIVISAGSMGIYVDDAGIPDGGTSDAGTSDAGTSDAGRDGAISADARVNDAATSG